METAYSTTKFAVYGLSMSLRPEAGIRGIRVSVVCPDFVSSNFFDSSVHVQYDQKKLFGLIPKMIYTTPERCARAALRGVACNRSVITIGTTGKILWTIYRWAPRLFILGQRVYARIIRRSRLGQ
jgi:short-subunit dehydrogenase